MPRPTISPSLSLPNGSLLILPETISPLSVSNIEDTHIDLIETTFPLLLPTTPVLELSISPFFWVFYSFFLSLSNRTNFIRTWNFPFYKYFTGVSIESAFVLQNNLGVLTSPSGGDGNIDPLFEILDRISNEEDFIPDFDENNWLDIPEDIRSIEMRSVPIPSPELRNVTLDNLRHPAPIVNIAPRVFNKIIYLTGFSNITTPDDHGTYSSAIVNVVQSSPFIRLIRTDGFLTATGARISTNFYLAFAEAMKFTTEGDVILVNQSISATKGLLTYEVPLIFDKLLWDLIRFLSNNGITIVLSAGNSRTNLNNVARARDIFAFANIDSGAIIVGQETIGGSTGRLVDVRCKNLPAGIRPNTLGESSAASAIVAGMVKNIQSYAISKGRYLLPSEIKNMLKSLPQPLEVTESPWLLNSTLQNLINNCIY